MCLHDCAGQSLDCSLILKDNILIAPYKCGAKKKGFMNLCGLFAQHFIDQCRLCPIKLEINAAFDLPNHGDIVSGEKNAITLKSTFPQFSFDKFVNFLF